MGREKRLLSRCLVPLAAFAFVQFSAPRAHALSKEFVTTAPNTSATYGVLAGTIVGAATLAFSQNPGDNLNRIARGASLGLYAGIALGLYVTYGVRTAAEEEQGDAVSSAHPIAPLPRLAVFPVSDSGRRKIDGVAAVWNVYRF